MLVVFEHFGINHFIVRPMCVFVLCLLPIIRFVIYSADKQFIVKKLYFWKNYGIILWQFESLLIYLESSESIRSTLTLWVLLFCEICNEWTSQAKDLFTLFVLAIGSVISVMATDKHKRIECETVMDKKPINDITTRCSGILSLKFVIELADKTFGHLELF